MPETPVSLAHDLPPDAGERLAAMLPVGVRLLAFTPGGGWAIVGTPTAAHAGYAARGIPDACFVKLGEFMRAGHAIRSLAFAPGGGWVIVSDQAYFASGIADDCFAALVAAWADGLRPSCIAFTPTGDGWALLAGARSAGRGVDAACWQALRNAAQARHPAQQLAFAPGGGWVLLAPGRVLADGIAPGCQAHLGQVAQQHAVERVAFTPGGGWAVGSNTLQAPLAADPLRELEQRLRLVNGTWRSLAERMVAHRVRGASIAVAVDGAAPTLTEHGLLGAAEPALRVVEQGHATFVISTEGGAEAALADEIEDALRRLYPAR